MSRAGVGSEALEFPGETAGRRGQLHPAVGFRATPKGVHAGRSSWADFCQDDERSGLLALPGLGLSANIYTWRRSSGEWVCQFTN